MHFPPPKILALAPQKHDRSWMSQRPISFLDKDLERVVKYEDIYHYLNRSSCLVGGRRQGIERIAHQIPFRFQKHERHETKQGFRPRFVDPREVHTGIVKIQRAIQRLGLEVRHATFAVGSSWQGFKVSIQSQ